MALDRNQTAVGQSWSALVHKYGTPESAAAFAPDAVFEASVLTAPLIGPEAIGTYFGASTAGLYQELSFTSETTVGRATFYQWTGQAFDIQLNGLTVVTKNEAGLIQNVRLFHSPYPVVLRFADELAKRLASMET